MEERIVTIRDIASDLGVSTSTVHKAIYNKKGVGEATRKRILDYVETHDFHINPIASSLKRRTVRLAYVGVEPDPSQNFFFRQINTGVWECFEEYRGRNVEMQSFITDDDPEEQRALLEKLFEEQHDTLDGMLLVCKHEYSLNPILSRYRDAGIRIVTLHSDARDSGRDCFVGIDNMVTGAVAQEILLNLGIPENGQILLLGGFQEVSNHRQVRSRFVDLMKKERPDVDIIDLLQCDSIGAMKEKIARYLRAFPEISAIYAITARSTYAMCCVIQEQGMSGKLKTVGTDVFEELAPFFEDRSLTATIFQDPRQCAATALTSLYNLVTMEQDVEEYQYQRSEIVIRSNFASFLV